MTTTQEALNALEGMTPDEIADLMRSRGIKAHKFVPTECAIAQYLNQETGARHSVGICSAGALRDFGKSFVGTPPVLLPLSVREFINGFDSGWYPDLVMGQTPIGETPISNAIHQFAEAA